MARTCSVCGPSARPAGAEYGSEQAANAAPSIRHSKLAASLAVSVTVNPSRLFVAAGLPVIVAVGGPGRVVCLVSQSGGAPSTLSRFRASVPPPPPIQLSAAVAALPHGAAV